MKTLLQINSVVNTGSTGKIVEEIGDLAINWGWQSYIAYGRNNRSSNSELIKIGNDLDIRLHGLQTRLFDSHGFGSIKATKFLIENVKKIKPNIIHIHNLHGYYINIEVLFNYLCTVNIPIVWTLHDCWALTGHCTYFDKINCLKWQTKCYECDLLSEYPKSLLRDRSEKNFQLKKNLFTNIKNLTIIPVSNWLENLVKQSFFCDSKIITIHNGVDLRTFRPINQSKLVQNLNLVNKINILNLADYVYFAGELYDEELLAPWFLTSKLLIHPASIGLSILHAFGYGLPVVAHNMGNLHGPEYCTFIPEKTGKNFQKDNINDLANTVVELINDQEARKLMKMETIRIARTKYNVDIMVERYLTIAKKALHSY